MRLLLSMGKKKKMANTPRVSTTISTTPNSITTAGVQSGQNVVPDAGGLITDDSLVQLHHLFLRPFRHGCKG